MKNPTKQIRIATTLLFLSVILTPIKNAFQSNIPQIYKTYPTFLIFLLPYLAISLTLIYKIRKRKNWARTTTLVLVPLLILLDLIALPYWIISKQALCTTLAIIQNLIRTIAIILLYKKTSRDWFNIKQKPQKKKTKHAKKIIVFASVLTVIILIYSLISFISPEEIVQKIGIRNGYIASITISFFGGFSSATALSMYATLAVLISGGLNPLILGILAGISLALGDILMFFLGGKGREMVSGKLEEEIEKLTKLTREKNLEKFIPIIAYIYMSFLPLPNDWLLLSLAAIEYPRKKMNIIIILGDITHAIVFTLLAANGIMLIS